jgi:hypothetical protein
MRHWKPALGTAPSSSSNTAVLTRPGSSSSTKSTKAWPTSSSSGRPAMATNRWFSSSIVPVVGSMTAMAAGAATGASVNSCLKRSSLERSASTVSRWADTSRMAARTR